MIRVAAGSVAKINLLEDDLRAQGYSRVGPLSKIAPMEYSKTHDFAAGEWSFTRLLRAIVSTAHEEMSKPTFQYAARIIAYAHPLKVPASRVVANRW